MEGWALPGHKGQVTDGVGASFLMVNTTETVIMWTDPSIGCHSGRPVWASISCEILF